MTVAVFFAKLKALNAMPPQKIIKQSSDALAEQNMDEMERQLNVAESAPDYVDPFLGLDDG